MVANKTLVENYNSIAKIPFVKRAIKRVLVLDKENKDLVSENRTLKKVIELLANKQPNCCCSCTKDTPLKINENVYIKQEKMTIDELSTSSAKNNEKVYIKQEKMTIDELSTSSAKNNDANIVYEIVSDNGEIAWKTDILPKLPILPNINNTIEITDNQETNNVIDSEDDDEFTCQECYTVQGKNNCELCDVEDVCEECHGQGGDYGPGEIWVCHECLPTCLECEAPLYTVDDECCGKGRSDEEPVEVEVEESEEEVEVEESEEEVEIEVEEEEVEVEVEESEEEVEVEVEESEEEEEDEGDGARFGDIINNDDEEEVEIEVEEEEEVEVEVEEEDEEEAYEVTIKKKLYYTTNEIDGIIYSIDNDDEIGDEVGHFKNGKPVFNKKK